MPTYTVFGGTLPQFNEQHDPRTLIISLYEKACVDYKTLTEHPPEKVHAN